MSQFLPIFVIIICIVGGGVLYYSIKQSRIKNQMQISQSQMTANDFVNVKDIKDRFLYTRDGQIIAYIKINPISIDLFSDTEKEQICRGLTAELSSIQKPFKFLAVSRPVDITPLINEYTALLGETTDQKQKELLRNEMMVMSNYAVSGEVIERQFYFAIWTRYQEGIEKDFLKECYEFVNKFDSSNISCDIIEEQEIVRLCNLINNPAYVVYEK